MSLLTAPIVKNSHTFARVYFIFLKKRPGENLKVFRYGIWTSEKELSSKKKLALFFELVALTLG